MTRSAAYGQCAVLFALCISCAPSDFDPIGRSAMALRPDSPGTTELPPAFSASDTVEHYDSMSGAFRIHYAESGSHAVPADDANTNDVPDFVESTAATYDEVLAFYRDTLGFSAPLSDETVSDDNGGSAAFDVYLLNFTIGADGAFRREACLSASPHQCTGYMVQENDFVGFGYASREDGSRVLASHEFFHAVQARYNVFAGSVIGEGTAVWATHAFDEDLEDLAGFAYGYLERTSRSLGQEPTGPVDSFTYGAGIFFQFLEERYDRVLIRELWEELAEADTDPDWLAELDTLLVGRSTSFAAAFADFCRWNLYTATRANPSESYAVGNRIPLVDETEVTVPLVDDSVRIFPAAARFHVSDAPVSGQISAALIAEDPSNGLGLHLAVERGGVIESVMTVTRAEVGSAEDLIVSAVLGSPATVHVVAFNTERSGSSQTPGLCIGTPAEVESCRNALQAMNTDDAGVTTEDDAGIPTDAGAEPPMMGGGGCSLDGSAGSNAAALFLAGLSLALRRRRSTSRI